MLTFIQNNWETLFEGGGVALIGALCTLIYNKIKNRNSNSNTNNQLTDNTIPVVIEKSVEKTEIEKTADRYKIILKLMNEEKHQNQYTITQLAKIMKLKEAGILENIFLAKKEAPFGLSQHFCDTFGVNFEWLTEGKEEPFYKFKFTGYEPLDHFDYIKQRNPLAIYFVKTDTKDTTTTIALQLTTHKFELINFSFYISKENGDGGRVMLRDFYLLIEKLKKDNKTNLKCYGLILNSKKYSSFKKGEFYPGKYLFIGMYGNYWWRDLPDIHHNNFSEDEYRERYGQDFLDAQEAIKEELFYYLKYQ